MKKIWWCLKETEKTMAKTITDYKDNCNFVNKTCIKY